MESMREYERAQRKIKRMLPPRIDFEYSQFNKMFSQVPYHLKANLTLELDEMITDLSNNISGNSVDEIKQSLQTLLETNFSIAHEGMLDLGTELKQLQQQLTEKDKQIFELHQLLSQQQALTKQLLDENGALKTINLELKDEQVRNQRGKLFGKSSKD